MRGITPEKAELTKEVASRLSNAKVDPGEVIRIIRYLHRTRDVANSRELLRRFSRDRRHYGRNLSQKRQFAAIDREFFALLSVCDDVDELLVLGTHVARLIPYFAQSQDQATGRRQ